MSPTESQLVQQWTSSPNKHDKTHVSLCGEESTSGTRTNVLSANTNVTCNLHFHSNLHCHLPPHEKFSSHSQCTAPKKLLCKDLYHTSNINLETLPRQVFYLVKKCLLLQVLGVCISKAALQYRKFSTNILHKELGIKFLRGVRSLKEKYLHKLLVRSPYAAHFVTDRHAECLLEMIIFLTNPSCFAQSQCLDP